MANGSNSIRTEIGGFFTLIGTPGIIISIGNRKEFKNGDTVVTMVDTASGREMETGLFEMALFRDPAGTLSIKVGILMPISDEKMKTVMDAVSSEMVPGSQRILADEPGIYVFRFEPKESAGSGTRIYMVVTRKGYFSGMIENATAKELEHYDRTFASALPMEDGGDKAEKAGKGDPDENLKIAGEILDEAKALLQENVQETAALKTRIDGLKNKAKAAEQAYSEEKKAYSLKWPKGRDELARDYSEAKQQIDLSDRLLENNKLSLSMCGLFDFARKKELRAEIQNCEEKLSELRQKMAKLTADRDACEPDWKKLENARIKSNNAANEQEMAEHQAKKLEKQRKQIKKQLEDAVKLEEDVRNGKYSGPSLTTVTVNSPERLQANRLESVLKRTGKFVSIDKIREADQVMRELPDFRLQHILDHVLIPQGRAERYKDENGFETLYGAKGVRKPIPLSDRDAWKNKIYMAMLGSRRAMTPIEIQKLDPDLGDISVPMISALLKVLLTEGLVTKDDSFSNQYRVT